VTDQQTQQPQQWVPQGQQPQYAPPQQGVPQGVPQQTPPQAPSAPAAPADDLDTMNLHLPKDEFTQLAEGWYKMLIEEVQRRDKNGQPLTSKSGERKVTWVFRVAEGARAGKKMFVHTNVAGAGTFSVRNILKVFHADLPSDEVDIRVHWPAYEGQYVWGYVAPQKNNPQYSEIAQYRPITDPPPGVGATGGPGPVLPPSPAPMQRRI
jgi:hypothetical protein